MDITSKEVLEDALLHFEGAVMFISHDRYFMSQIANRVFSFENKGVVRFDCDYHDYMMQKGTELTSKVTARYVEGDRYKITNHKEVVIEQVKSKVRGGVRPRAYTMLPCLPLSQSKPSDTPLDEQRNFGGSGVTSGDKGKGIKNFKRFKQD